MTEEAEKQGLRQVGNPPMHSDVRPANRDDQADTAGEDETGLAPRGEPAQHEPEFAQIQGSRRGGGATPSAMRSGDNPQPADE